MNRRNPRLGGLLLGALTTIACTVGGSDEDLRSVQSAGTILLACPDASKQPIQGRGDHSVTGIADLGKNLFLTCDEAMKDVSCNDMDASDLEDAAEARALKRCERDIKNTFSCAEPCRQEIDATPCKIEDSDASSTAACQEVTSDDGSVKYLGYCSLLGWATAKGQSTGRCI
jgi:hypothetical protein